MVSSPKNAISKEIDLYVLGSNFSFMRSKVSLEYFKLITEMKTRLELIKSTNFFSFHAVLLDTP